MTGLPSITIVGKLTGDPELRMLPSGVARATVNIAANERKYNRETQQYENGDATFLRGTIWRQYAENVAESLRKGDNVIVTGRLRQRDYEKDGQRRSSFELDVDEIGLTLRFNKATSERNQPVAAGAGWGTSTDEPDW